jgi:hypothetical protein
MLARSDETYPVWGPRKIEEPVLRPGYRPVCIVTEERRLRLAALGVNTLQAVRSAGRIGVQPRTLAAGTAGAADWQSLAARRLALFILNSVERGTRWVVLTRPTDDVAHLATVQLQDFFERLHAAGAFGARTLEEAYFVICDDRVNLHDGRAPNSFQILLGFAAQRRGEYHSFRICHSPAGSKVTPVSLNRLNLMRGDAALELGGEGTDALFRS